jgi:hypothetical protein
MKLDGSWEPMRIARHCPSTARLEGKTEGGKGLRKTLVREGGTRPVAHKHEERGGGKRGQRRAHPNRDQDKTEGAADEEGGHGEAVGGTNEGVYGQGGRREEHRGCGGGRRCKSTSNVKLLRRQNGPRDYQDGHPDQVLGLFLHIRPCPNTRYLW